MSLGSGGVFEAAPHSVDEVGLEDEDKRFIAHSRACQLIHIEGDDDFECFCTETAALLDGGPVFHPATSEGPSGSLGRESLRDVDWAALNAFIESKPGRSATSNTLYRQLRDGEIRILELYPAGFEEPLKGALHIASIDFEYPVDPSLHQGSSTGTSEAIFAQRELNHAVSLIDKGPIWYTTLSYVWGAPIFDQSINIGDYRIKITSSLATAMRHVRSLSGSIFLWIDQICINQPDISDKVLQIPLMGMIYAYATNTLIWLGEEDEADLKLAVRAFQDVHARLRLSDAMIRPEDFAELHIAPAHDRSWWAVRQFFRNFWFTRTWTMQEAILSRQCYIQCGTTILLWDDIAAWVDTLDQSGLLDWLMAHNELDVLYTKMPSSDVLLPPMGGKVMNRLQKIRQKTRLFELKDQRKRKAGKLGTNSLLECLVMARDTSAAEPKDKVYGVLGFADVYITPNYSPAVKHRDVYLEASITQLMSNAFALPLLSCVDAETPLRPSWVPDWGTPRVTQALGYSTKVWGLYMAGGGHPFERKGRIPVILSDDSKRITIKGKIFDKIAQVGAVSVDPVFCIDLDKMETNSWAAYAQLADNSVSNATYSAQNDTVYDAFFQTLMAGRDGTGTSILCPNHSEIFGLILDESCGLMFNYTTYCKPSLPGQTYSARRKKGYFTLRNLAAPMSGTVRKPIRVLEDMRKALKAALHMRRFAVTTRGYFALVPRDAKVSDDIVVFEHCCVPFLVRSVQEPGVNGEVFELVGETYVHGIMKGEVMDMHELPLRDVTLIFIWVRHLLQMDLSLQLAYIHITLIIIISIYHHNTQTRLGFLDLTTSRRRAMLHIRLLRQDLHLPPHNDQSMAFKISCRLTIDLTHGHQNMSYEDKKRKQHEECDEGVVAAA